MNRLLPKSLLPVILFYTAISLNAQIDSTYDKKHDMGFDFKIGAGLIRNQVAPSIDFRLHYTRLRLYKIQLAYQNYFLFERQPDRNFDMFTHSLVALNFLKYRENNVWSGVSIGYMIARRGEYFKGSTLKLGFPLEVEKRYFSAFNLIICPEIWFTNDFKTIFPGISLKF